MSDPTQKAIGLGIAGGAIAAALLDHLVAKGVIVADEQRAILDDALYRAAMHTGTWEGHEATIYIGTLLDALPSDVPPP